MDRERLKEVRQTDLTESKVNEDFVDWLKTKGPTWLLAVLIAVCVYLVVVRVRQARETKQHEAWAAFYAAELPGSYEDVARDYGGIGGLRHVARIAAADALLRAVQSGRPLGSDAGPLAPAPDPETWTQERDRYLTRAAGLYEEVAADIEGDATGLTIYAVSAMNGRAAVAESRGDGAEAAAWYVRAADRAEGEYPALEILARERAGSAVANSRVVTLPTDVEVRAIAGDVGTVRSAAVIDALQPFIMPADETADD